MKYILVALVCIAIALHSHETFAGDTDINVEHGDGHVDNTFGATWPTALGTAFLPSTPPTPLEGESNAKSASTADGVKKQAAFGIQGNKVTDAALPIVHNVHHESLPIDVSPHHHEHVVHTPVDVHALTEPEYTINHVDDDFHHTLLAEEEHYNVNEALEAERAKSLALQAELEHQRTLNAAHLQHTHDAAHIDDTHPHHNIEHHHHHDDDLHDDMLDDIMHPIAHTSTHNDIDSDEQWAQAAIENKHAHNHIAAHADHHNLHDYQHDLARHEASHHDAHIAHDDDDDDDGIHNVHHQPIHDVVNQEELHDIHDDAETYQDEFGNMFQFDNAGRRLYLD